MAASAREPAKSMPGSFGSQWRRARKRLTNENPHDGDWRRGLLVASQPFDWRNGALGRRDLLERLVSRILRLIGAGWSAFEKTRLARGSNTYVRATAYHVAEHRNRTPMGSWHRYVVRVVPASFDCLSGERLASGPSSTRVNVSFGVVS